MEDKLVKVKQLVVVFNEYPLYDYKTRIKDVELYTNEFHYFNEDDICINNDGGRYICEIFFPFETKEDEIVKFEKNVVRKKMIEYFQNKIDKYKNFIEKIMKTNE